MQVEAGENLPDIDRVGARVEGKGLRMAPFPWHLDYEREEASGQEASGPSWHPAFLLVRMKCCGRDGGTQDSAGENGVLVKSVAS